MAAAILHSHQNTDVTTAAAVLPEARLMTKYIKVLVPADKGRIRRVLLLVPDLQGHLEADFLF